jgi:hypothetical protein
VPGRLAELIAAEGGIMCDQPLRPALH